MHRTLQSALINKASPDDVRRILDAACVTYCSDKVDLLLICSWLQTPNILWSLADVFSAEDWAIFLDEFSQKISSTCKFAEFNDANLRNEEVVQHLQNVGIIITPSVIPASWIAKTVWGQTFWLPKPGPTP